MASAVLPSGPQCAAAAVAAAAAAPPGLRLRLLLLLLSAAALIPTGRCGHRPVGPRNLLRHPGGRSHGGGKRFHDNLPPLPKSKSEGEWRGNSGLRMEGVEGIGKSPLPCPARCELELVGMAAPTPFLPGLARGAEWSENVGLGG